MSEKPKRPEYTVLCEDWIAYVAHLEAQVEALLKAIEIYDLADMRQNELDIVLKECKKGACPTYDEFEALLDKEGE